jgi:branched-subunit amino acid permease
MYIILYIYIYPPTILILLVLFNQLTYRSRTAIKVYIYITFILDDPNMIQQSLHHQGTASPPKSE